jgi:hypothetical protein
MRNRISYWIFFLLFGCAASTQDLISQAKATGDWSQVERRFEVIERREARRPPSCPNHTKAWCVPGAGGGSCSCITAADFARNMQQVHR